MSDTQSGAASVGGIEALASHASTAAAGSPAAGAPVPPLLLTTQYVRDLVFRVPGAPAIYAQPQLRPHVAMHLDVQVRPAQEGHPVFEVTLLIKCTASIQAPVEGEPPPLTAFLVELAYSGIFTLQNVAQPMVEPLLLAECPRLLFPFARSVLADITREAGFPPVLLQPIDFVAMWQSRRGQAQAAAAAPEPAQAAG